LTKIENLLSVNKKCRVEIGFDNTIPPKVYYTGGVKIDGQSEIE